MFLAVFSVHSIYKIQSISGLGCRAVWGIIGLCDVEPLGVGLGKGQA